MKKIIVVLGIVFMVGCSLEESKYNTIDIELLKGLWSYSNTSIKAEGFMFIENKDIIIIDNHAFNYYVSSNSVFIDLNTKIDGDIKMFEIISLSNTELIILLRGYTYTLNKY